jgi:hypothetical protein
VLCLPTLINRSVAPLHASRVSYHVGQVPIMKDSKHGNEFGKGQVGVMLPSGGCVPLFPLAVLLTRNPFLGV